MRREALATQQARGPAGPLLSQTLPSGDNVSAGPPGPQRLIQSRPPPVLRLIRGSVFSGCQRLLGHEAPRNGEGGAVIITYGTLCGLTHVVRPTFSYDSQSKPV